MDLPRPLPPATAQAPSWLPGVVRIAIVDDHALVRTGLRCILQQQADLQVVAEAGNGREALDIVRRGGVDLVLLDIGMPGQSGIDVLAAIRAREAALPVLIVSGHAEADYAPTLLRLGASGYVHKGASAEELLAAVRTVHRGGRHVSAALAELLATQLGSAEPVPPHQQLSERELQVFLRLAQGETVGHLADGLCLSAKTVSTYRSRVLEKMRARSNSELTRYALNNGLIR